MARKNVLIMGAAGRDFHNFNVLFRGNKDYNVVAFTATQIPDIEGRVYPRQLAGKLYPKGIKIYEEKDLAKLIKKFRVDEVIFSYSDVQFEYVMTKASIVNALGISFRLLGSDSIAVALRVEARIFAQEDLLEEATIEIADDESVSEVSFGMQQPEPEQQFLQQPKPEQRLIQE